VSNVDVTSAPPVPSHRRHSRHTGHGRHGRHRSQRSRRRWPLVTTAVMLVLAAVPTYLMSTRPAPAGRAGTGPTLAIMPFHPSNPVTLTGDLWWSWALMDRRTGQVWGSSTMDQTTWTASMIKAWLAADYLRNAGKLGQTPSADRLHTIQIMIRDSDNNAANTMYALDGQAASIARMVSICGLTDSSANPAGWAVTNLSARDAVRMGTCIAGGRGAGPHWTTWLLTQMRAVEGEGNFGIRDAFPASQASDIAIKNGYEDFAGDGLYHVNCLAVGDTWTLAVMQRYAPQSTWDPDLALGADRCTRVATQLLAGH
jgi:hypothetical protein